MLIQIEETGGNDHGRIQDITDDSAPLTDECFICDKKAVLQSEAYPDQVAFCSEAHRKLHFSDEDEELDEFPVASIYKAGIGRCLVAARDLSAGEMIFTETPVVIGPHHKASPTCLDCMRKVDGSFLCPKCNFPMCDPVCADGEDHSLQECTVFSQIEPKVRVENFTENDPRYWSVSVLRCLLFKEQNPEKYDIVTRMLDHHGEHEKDPETHALYKKNVVDFLLKDCSLSERFTEEEIWHVLGAIDINSVRIHALTKNHSDDSPQSGHALYPITALISHACICNSKTVITENFVAKCVATVDIAKGEEITKQYVSPLETTQMRREQLRQGWYFDCHCQRCQDPTELGSFISATSCLRCQGGIILPTDPLDDDGEWICQTCNFRTNGSSVSKLVEYFCSKMSALRPEAIDDWEDLLSKAMKMFHPNHYVLTLMRIYMNGHYIQLTHRSGLLGDEVPVEVFLRRKDLLDEVHRVIDIIEPGYSRRRGLSLFETSTCHLQIGRLLHEADRFPIDDFMKLCEAEMVSLKDCLRCLETWPEGSNEAAVYYKASGAIAEAEHMIRVLKYKKEQSGLSE